ncbi:TonB-dependent receptor [Acetobacter fallax]|uniref:TonB-dependent receptor plug domain-containing protein n=1 Tax=Acetobacter fallax TaxID=1737473 RepID=A0ABX0K515_9PROT|nr:TonB-dependent receptor plug domain-containing protein [Acetobacter fallax]NHO31411.1 TonB-dependent receptor plug domain-containing protein [Acetobacter fallax]NHO35007.1 TonB-dependent receptor plug domain-containing protein [Acetobacter fallax]
MCTACATIGTAALGASPPRPAPVTTAASTPEVHAGKTAQKTQAIQTSATHQSAPQTTSAQGTPESIVISARKASPDGAMGHSTGAGMMPAQTIAKARSAFTRDFIARQSPTTNTASMISSMPGVAVGKNDPLGLDDQRINLTVRGLGQTEIGYVMDGIPAADPSNYKLYTTQNVDNENLERVDLTQGSASPTSPLYNAVGGELSQTLRNPLDHAAGMLNLSGGSYSLDREFARFDTGELGHSGIRSYASFSHTHANDWRGPTYTTRYHMDNKTLKEWGNNSVELLVSYNSMTSFYPRFPTLSQWDQYGTKFNWDKHYTPGSANYYKFQQNVRNAITIGAPMHFDLSHGLTFHVTPYYMRSTGYGDVGSSLSNTGSYLGNIPAGNLNVSPSYNGTFPVSIDDVFKENNAGINAYMTWKSGHNTLSFGYWYAYYAQPEETSYAAADANGNIASMSGAYPVKTTAGNILRSYNINFMQQTNSAFITDEYKALNDRLVLTAAFREVMVSRKLTQLMPGLQNYINGNSDAVPLPQVTASYRITPDDQIFINGTTGFAEPAGWPTYADFISVATGKQSRGHASNLRPEYSISEEIGYRHTGLANVNISLFNYNFTNRQVSTTAVVGGAMVSSSINGGGQTSRGATIEVGLRPWHHFSPYVSGQYLHATIDNNLRASNGDYLPTAGKMAVNTPEFTASVGLLYDNGTIFGNLLFNYVSSQYSTFMNDQKYPAYQTLNIGLGYRFHSWSYFQHPQIQLNLVNLGLGNSGYLSSTYSVSTNAKAVRGIYGTEVAGTAPTYNVGGGFAGVVSVSTGF